MQIWKLTSPILRPDPVWPLHATTKIMKIKFTINHWLAVLALSFIGLANSTALAQGGAFTYQGRVTDNGTNFTGLGQFQFALVTSSNANHTATATATLGGTGPYYVNGYTITSGGGGYVTAPAVTVSGGGGSGATATATISGGVVNSLTPGYVGSGYTSAPTVTIAPPPANITYTTYWSNDGTSSAGSEPAAAVGVPVSNGLFTVILGDPTLANMEAMSPALFTQPDLQLRLWFSDGVNDFAALSPPQNLTPAPYASFAGGASNLLGNIAATQLTGSLPVSQLTGTVPLAQLPASVVTNNASSVNLNGAFTGNGAALTNLQLAAIGQPGTFSLLSGYFAPPVTLNVGMWPSSVVAADANGDGPLDLICANNGGNTLTVLTNNGRGGFGSSATLNVGNGPQCVAAADVNGDGHPDLICANSADNTLTVLTNNGSGGFGSNATLNAGSYPVCVVAADITGDGWPDLICANSEGHTLTVLTNNGSGVFGSNATLNVGSTPFSVAAADVNGDGRLDLICANSGGNTLTVLTNNGSGGFGSNATLNVGRSPQCVCAADVNGDGRLDLICANSGGGTLTVLTNNGSGGFGSNATLHVGSNPVSVVAADVNGDGKLDLICANSEGNTLTVLTNNGSGGFGFNATLNVGSNPDCVVAADVNGDGRPDLICANINDNTLMVILNLPAVSANGNFNGNFNGTLGGNALTINDGQSGLGVGTNIYLNNYAIYLRRDQNHGLAYNGGGVTNFPSGAVLPDGPVLWGYTGGALGVLNGGAQAMLNWNNTGVSVNGTLAGNGSGLTNLNAASLTGIVSQTGLGTNGTFTPTIGDGLSDNFATSTATGNYVKVGSLVYVEIWIKWTGKGSANSSSGVCVSLPVPVASQRAVFSLGFNSGFTFTGQLTASSVVGWSYLALDNVSNTGGTGANVTVANCATSGELQLSGFYRWQ